MGGTNRREAKHRKGCHCEGRTAAPGAPPRRRPQEESKSFLLCVCRRAKKKGGGAEGGWGGERREGYRKMGRVAGELALDGTCRLICSSCRDSLST